MWGRIQCENKHFITTILLGLVPCDFRLSKHALSNLLLKGKYKIQITGKI